MVINWENEESYLFINPAFPTSLQEKYRRLITQDQSHPGHFWLSTSGSSTQKWVGLSKQAVLHSAKIVNHYLESNASDCWILALPCFHVGGLAINARAYLSGARVEDFRRDCKEKWNPSKLYDFLFEKKGTLLSLVPAQFFDLISLGYPPPPSLRVVILGGGALHPELYERGVALGWPILHTYGMTECSSQIASSALKDVGHPSLSHLELLPHFEVKKVGEILAFKSPSLFTAYANFEEDAVTFHDPKVDGWFLSGDRGRCNSKGVIFPLGRLDAVIKIGGENVDLAYLDRVLHGICIELDIPCEATIIAQTDMRLGLVITLVLTHSLEILEKELINRFNQSVLPFEKIRGVLYREELPRSALGKILKNELMALH